MNGRKKRRNNSRDRAEPWIQGLQQGLSPRFLLFSSFQPSFLLAASPLPLLPRAFCSFVFILPVPTRLPPTVASDRNPAHAFPSYFNGLFCLLSFSDPSLSFCFFFVNPHSPPLVPARRTTVLLRQDDSAVSLPSASSLHICAAFVPWQGRIWNGLLAASGRLMGNEILERGCGAMEGIAEEIWMH